MVDSIPKIFVVGDSISIQYGPYLAKYLEGVAVCARKRGDEEALRDLDVPQGANGGDSSMVLNFLRAMSRYGGIDADLLLVNCGLHDIKTDIPTGAKQVPLDQYRQNLREIVALVSTLKPRLVWIRTTPCDEKVHNHTGVGFHRFAADGVAYNAAADAIMADAGIPAIDLYGFTLKLGPDLYCDHVHFFEPIREKQAAYLAGWIQCFLTREPGS